LEHPGLGHALLAVMAVVALQSSACSKGCKPGYGLVGSQCLPLRTDSQLPAAGTGSGAQAQSSEVPSDAPKTGASGSAANPTASTARGASGSAAAKSAGAKTGVEAGAAAMAAHPSSASASDDPCAGQPDGGFCDGATMRQCSGGAESAAETICADETSCQTGLRSGICAVCIPGTFQCEGARLNSCSDAGQYEVTEECATPELCKADAGLCTEMQCAPDAVSCSSDGTTLNTCNEDGSSFASQEHCMGKGCNSSQKSCNSCKPGEKTCSGTSVETCNADGQTTAITPCSASNECSATACNGGRCAPEKMPTGSPCSRGKCDATGNCVQCLAAADCASENACTIPACSAGACRPKNAPNGTQCGSSNMKCDGSGRCAEKNPCGDGVFDPTKEACDPLSDEWKNSGGACDDNCRLTAKTYKACQTAGQSCWTGSPAGLFCSLTGACTLTCNTSTDCPPGGTCALDTGRPPQRICITTSCQTGTSLQYYARQGCFSSSTDMKDPCYMAPAVTRMCGWISADPETGRQWCPGEGPACAFSP
jgi:hypothetical protein